MCMATIVLFYHETETRGNKNNMHAMLIMLGSGLRRDVVHKIPTFFLLYDRVLPTFPVLL